MTKINVELPSVISEKLISCDVKNISHLISFLGKSQNNKLRALFQYEGDNAVRLKPFVTLFVNEQLCSSYDLNLNENDSVCLNIAMAGG